jgi:fibronectin type 3 domain-containing protein
MYKNILLIICVALSVANGNVYAQNKNAHSGMLLFNSARGTILLFGNNSINSNSKDSKGAQYTLSRTEQKTGAVKQLQLPGMAKDFSSFKKIIGETLSKQLQRQLKLSTENALWVYIQSHPDLSAYGLMALGVPFRTAMGTAYMDEDVKNKKGETFKYTLQVSGTNNNNYTSTITIGQVPDFNAPKLIVSKATDSFVSIRWKAKMNNDFPYFASVYKQTGDRGSFQKLSARILVSKKNDSVYFLFTEKVNANSAYKYFIRPIDLLDNEGSFNSDTVSLVAANFGKLPAITQLKATDTLNSILLSWKQLPSNSLLTGIEIQRSHDSRGDYVIIDTINASANTYHDTKLLPHVAYYYRLAVLHAGTQEKNKFYTKVSAARQKINHAPDAPYGITVKANEKGVRIAWQPVNDLDLYAYYVYRGTSLSSKMEVISPSLTDTVFTDTTSNLSRQTAYVYAVKSVSNGAKESPFSEKVSAHLPFGKEKPLTPGGIRTTVRNNRLFIEWEDVKKNDPAIIGYILYKHKTGSKPLQYAANKPASAEATRLQLEPVAQGVITVPYYEDTISQYGDKYEYLVSAIDQFGTESGLSATAFSPKLSKAMITAPAQVYVRSVKEGVAIQWEQADATNVQSFAIYRRSITEKSAKKIATVKSPANQYTDKQVAQGNLYVYSIAAITTAGESAGSIEKSIRK